MDIAGWMDEWMDRCVNKRWMEEYGWIDEEWLNGLKCVSVDA